MKTINGCSVKEKIEHCGDCPFFTYLEESNINSPLVLTIMASNKRKYCKLFGLWRQTESPLPDRCTTLFKEFNQAESGHYFLCLNENEYKRKRNRKKRNMIKTIMNYHKYLTTLPNKEAERKELEEIMKAAKEKAEQTAKDENNE